MSLSRESSPMDQIIGTYVHIVKIVLWSTQHYKKNKFLNQPWRSVNLRRFFFLVLCPRQLLDLDVSNFEFWIFVLIFLTAATACRKQEQIFKIQSKSSCFLRSPQKWTKSSPSIWRLLSKCQIDGEDFVNFCGLIRKHELLFL